MCPSVGTLPESPAPPQPPSWNRRNYFKGTGHNTPALLMLHLLRNLHREHQGISSTSSWGTGLGNAAVFAFHRWEITATQSHVGNLRKLQLLPYPLIWKQQERITALKHTGRDAKPSCERQDITIQILRCTASVFNEDVRTQFPNHVWPVVHLSISPAFPYKIHLRSIKQ